jgi:hypothetical protein
LEESLGLKIEKSLGDTECDAPKMHPKILNAPKQNLGAPFGVNGLHTC